MFKVLLLLFNIEKLKEFLACKLITKTNILKDSIVKPFANISRESHLQRDIFNSVCLETNSKTLSKKSPKSDKVMAQHLQVGISYGNKTYFIRLQAAVSMRIGIFPYQSILALLRIKRDCFLLWVQMKQQWLIKMTGIIQQNYLRLQDLVQMNFLYVLVIKQRLIGRKVSSARTFLAALIVALSRQKQKIRKQLE